MNIGYLVPDWPNQTHAFFWREISALRTLGNTVTLFSTTRPAPDACRHSFGKEARQGTIYLFPPRVHRAIAILARNPLRTLGALEYIRNLKETPFSHRLKLLGMLLSSADLVAHCEAHGVDHLHAQSCGDLAHLVALAQRLGGPKYSLVLHGDLPVYGVDHRAKMECARFVVTVTKPLQQQVLDVTKRPAREVPVIWMGVDTSYFTPREHVHEPKNQKGLNVITVGRLNKTKGHPHVLDAIRNLQSDGIVINYSIVGEGPYREALEKMITRLELASRVHFLGNRSEDEVRTLLRSHDVFVLASEGLGEAAPVSVMEAMSCGLPVVVSRIGGTTDMIDDERTGLLIEQCDVLALEGALRRLIQDADIRAELGRNVRASARENFDFRRQAEQLAQVLNTPWT